MAADSPGQTALALWSRLAHDRLWPDPSPTAIRNAERSGGPDLWRRLQAYRRWRDQRRVLVESRGGPEALLPYVRVILLGYRESAIECVVLCLWCAC
jgi:hypothetical protein